MDTDPASFVLERQLAWSRRHGISLQGSKGVRGRPTYAALERNLFEPLSPEAQDEYSHGDGRELGGNDGNPGKMQALHSSSALCCNVFHYWRGVGRADVIAKACGVPERGVAVTFEQQLPIDRSQFRYAPISTQPFDTTVDRLT